jgi:hypothetical protein
VRYALVAVVAFTAGWLIGAALTPRLPQRTLRKVTSMRHSAWEWVKGHVVVIALVGLLLALLSSGATLIVYTHFKDKFQEQQNCMSTYVSGAAPFVQARDDGVQRLLDDVSTHAGTAKFYRDLSAEKKDSDALKAYRASHVPSKACPS